MTSLNSHLWLTNKCVSLGLWPLVMRNMRRWCALVTAIAAVESQFSPNFNVTYSEWMTQLRHDKLSNPNDKFGYDRSVPPVSSRLFNYSAAGTDVRIQMRWYKLENVDIESGTLSAKIWFRMAWTDARLSWNPADYGGITRA